MQNLFKFLINSILLLQPIFIVPLNSQSVNDELLLVEAVWRHGDRSPTDTFPSDPNREDKWPQGWGQLTPLGMAQHVVLGNKLAQKYIQELKFISPQYKNKEIYVRSTDLNRTLTSAISNMIGFYHQGIAGTDFPGQQSPAPWWPNLFTPVAIHTIQSFEDHLMPDIPYVPCPRQDKLHKMVRETPEFKQMMVEKKWLFDTLSELSGQKIDVFNFWVIADTLFIEDIYEKEYHLEMPTWTKNRTLRNEIEAMGNLFEDWTEGKGLQPFNGVKFDEELPRIRGGPILWILIGNMQNKLACIHPEMKKQLALKGKKSPLGSPICHWMDGKKYFAYSAHDTTIAALFSALGFEKTNYDHDGFPHYSACVTFELWKNASSNEPYIKAFYWLPNIGTKVFGAEEITFNISGCSDGCTFNHFIERSKKYQPIPSIDAYCKNTNFPTNNNAIPIIFPKFIYAITFFVIFLNYSF